MTATLARGISEQGFDVDVVLARAEGPYLARLPSQVHVVDLKASRTLTALPKLARYLREERPSALLSVMDHANIIALWATKLSRVPVRTVVSVRTMTSEMSRIGLRRDRLTPFFIKRFYPWADAIVAVSRGVADDLKQLLPSRAADVKVIYNPVVTPEFSQEAQEPLHHPWFQPGQPPVILGVGRLHQVKDFATLLRAFSLVIQTRPARLMILGEGPEQLRLETLAHELGILEEVSLPGFKSNPLPYFAQAAVYALSSTLEGLPAVLIEALACGTPVVATDCPTGPREILEGGRWGLLVPRSDPAALARGIIDTLETEPDRDALRRRGSEFSLAEATAKYTTLLFT